RLQLSTSYHPQTDGLAERHIRTVEDALRRFLAFDPTWTDEAGFTHDWVELLPGLEFAINSSKHATLASSSFANMLLASQARAATCIADAADYAKQRWDDKHAEPPFEVGDEVMLSSKHFHFRGERKLIPPQPAPPQPDIIDGQAHWVVDQILDERRPPAKRGAKNKQRVVEYLVKWEGRPDNYNR
ncbi:hypothetical protein JCM1841_006081, partial [Sporobolomyces salmonicolor]